MLTRRGTRRAAASSVLAVLASLTIEQSWAVAQCEYELTVLEGQPDDDGETRTSVDVINDLGQAVGWDRGGFFVWTPEAGIMPIKAPELPNGYRFIDIAGMNNLTGNDGVGQVIFNYWDMNDNFHGFLYDDGAWIDLVPKGTSFLSVRAINDAGQICGNRTTLSANGPYRWDAGMFQDFEEPNHDQIAWAMNKHGIVAGTDFPSYTAFTWDGDFQYLGKLFPGAAGEEARAIDSYGRIAGMTYYESKETEGHYLPRTFYWHDGNAEEIARPDTLPYSYFRAMNDLGQIVHHAFESGGPTGAALTQHGNAYFIEDIFQPPDGTVAVVVQSINNRGQIGGTLVLSTDVLYPHTVGMILTPKNRPLGDIDCDCVVDSHDLMSVLRDWGPCDGVGVCVSDIVSSTTFQPPGDGVVDGADLAVVLGNWGASTAVR